MMQTKKIMNRKEHRKVKADKDKDNIPSTSNKEYFAAGPNIEDEGTWCLRETEWTTKLKKYIDNQANRPKAERDVFELHMQLFRCAIKEIGKVKQEFMKFATSDLNEPAIEENLRDYRECILPIIHRQVYSNFDAFTIPYCYDYAFRVGQSYRLALLQMVVMGCRYQPKLKPQAERAYSFILNIMCLVFRAEKFLNIKRTTMKNVALPDYVTDKHTSNTILFIRDFLIIRDFHDYCKRMALVFTFVRRKLVLNKLAREWHEPK